MGATKLGCGALALLTLVSQTGAQEVALGGPVGAGRRFEWFDYDEKPLMAYSGGVHDWGNIYYSGGDPGCCEMCKKEFEKGGSVWSRTDMYDYSEFEEGGSVWGRTDMYDFSWDHKYNFTSCTCYSGPSDPEKLAKINVSDDILVAGYCGNNATFADISFGDEMTFFFKSVENIGWARDVETSDDCCESCKDESPGTELFVFHEYTKGCNCFKSIPGTRPETYGQGNYAG